MTNPYEPKTVAQILDKKIGGPDAPYRQTQKTPDNEQMVVLAPMRLARMLKLYVSATEGYSSAQLAMESGVSESTISRFLAGKQMPEAKAFAALVTWCFGEHRA